MKINIVRNSCGKGDGDLETQIPSSVTFQQISL